MSRGKIRLDIRRKNFLSRVTTPHINPRHVIGGRRLAFEQALTCANSGKISPQPLMIFFERGVIKSSFVLVLLVMISL